MSLNIQISLHFVSYSWIQTE